VVEVVERQPTGGPGVGHAGLARPQTGNDGRERWAAAWRRAVVVVGADAGPACSVGDVSGDVLRVRPQVRVAGEGWGGPAAPAVAPVRLGGPRSVPTSARRQR
jgi:hypothetical protein